MNHRVNVIEFYVIWGSSGYHWIKTSDPVKEALSILDENDYAFRMLLYSSTIRDNEEYNVKRLNYSGFYYPGGKTWTTEELKNGSMGEELISRSQRSGGLLVQCCKGNWHSFDPSKDQVL
jgi:hypothetical protein